jgi:hypothetical protein
MTHPKETLRTIRASEIGLFLYCRRAWWYRQQGVEPSNQADLAAGTALHRRHGRQVLAVGLLRWLGTAFLLGAAGLLVFYLTLTLLR